MSAAVGAVVTALPSPAAAAAGPGNDAADSPPPRPPTSARRIPPPCWTHEEALVLIDAYREKWLALRRGNLRAPHWEEVAAAVAARCPAAKPKTPIQCRHKIEKLRKRYRAEKRRPASSAASARSPSPSAWLYFQKFDAMDPDPSPSPSPAAPLVTIARPPPPSDYDSSDSSSGADDGGEANNTRSLHRLMSNGVGVRFHLPKPNPLAGPNPNPNFPKRRRLSPEKMRRGEDDGGDGVEEVAAAIRQLADEYMRVEKMKMEAARERERVRMEMEMKRMRMVLESQEQIIQSFITSFTSQTNIKRPSSTED